jgi:hypothetical protein
MRVIPPLEITNARLTSTTAPEPGVGEAAFNIATTYATNDKVIVGSPTHTVTITVASPGVLTWTAHGQADATPVVLTTTGALPTGLTAGARYFIVNSTADTFQLSAEPNGAPIVTTGAQSGTHTATAEVHRTYMSREDTNVGNSPMISPDKWTDVGPTNAWAMFDLLRSTSTYLGSLLTVVITPGVRVDTLGLDGIVADSVTAVVSVGGSPIKTITKSLRTRIVRSWRNHFFAPFTTASVFSTLDLPPATNAVITITLTRAQGDVALAGMVLGMSEFLGTALNNTVDDADNFSRVDEDPDFGDRKLTPRQTKQRLAIPILCPAWNVVSARSLRKKLAGRPALWIGLDDEDGNYFESVFIVGFYTEMPINLDDANQAVIPLVVKEV